MKDGAHTTQGLCTAATLYLVDFKPPKFLVTRLRVQRYWRRFARWMQVVRTKTLFGVSTLLEDRSCKDAMKIS